VLVNRGQGTRLERGKETVLVNRVKGKGVRGAPVLVNRGQGKGVKGGHGTVLVNRGKGKS